MSALAFVFPARPSVHTAKTTRTKTVFANVIVSDCSCCGNQI